jgi:hypothetical protein
MKPEVIDAILALKKDAKFILYDNDFDTIEWHDENPDNITKEQVEKKLAELQEIYDSFDYQRKRKPEYPSLEECIHAILDDKLEELQAKRLAVKEKYPKPVVEEPKPELKDGN